MDDGRLGTAANSFLEQYRALMQVISNHDERTHSMLEKLGLVLFEEVSNVTIGHKLSYNG